MLLGIDIGTSAVKVLLVSDEGRPVASGSAACAFDTPRPGWTETPAPRWWDATVAALESLRAATDRSLRDVQAVGLSGQMHGAVLLDEAAIRNAAGGPVDAVRPVLMWNDQRTAGHLAEIERAAGGRAALIRRTGNAALAGFTAPKLLWSRDEEPERFRRVQAFTCPKDFVRLQLCGELAIDVGDAAGTLVFDPARRAWDASLAESLGLSRTMLPPVLESGAVAGQVTAWAAEATGLSAGIPVVAGSGDNQCGAIGAGIVAPGHVLATLGTSGVVYAHADEPRVDLPADGAGPEDAPTGGRVHCMCAADGTAASPGHWAITACVLSAAGALQWARDVIAPTVPYDTLLGEASLVAPGCDGLRFLPHLAGERCPYPAPHARGAWTGLSLAHGRPHLIRAVLEGVTCTMAMVLDIVRGLPVPVERVRLGGGGNRSELWRRLQADLYGVPVASLDVDEGPAFGAALLAGVGSGVFDSLEATLTHALRETEVLDPEPTAASATLVDEYRALYAALEPVMDTGSRD